MATFSRGRKPKKRIEQRPTIEKIKGKREGVLLRFVKYCVTHWVAALISLVAALIAVGTPVWQAFVDPDVGISEAGAILPFAAPIQITNRFIFTMYKTSLRCVVKNVSWRGGSGGEISEIEFDIPAISTTIKPGKTANLQCRISSAKADTLDSADVFVGIEYYTFGWWHRLSDTTEFTWFTGSNPPRWIKGAFPAPMKSNGIIRPN
jgi:hypothetical protein